MKSISLLVAFPLWAGSATAGVCDFPAEFQNRASVDLDTLWVGFATDKDSYLPTETVHFFLVVKNNGAGAFYLNWGVDPQDGFFVLPDTCISVDQPGCLDDPAYYFPQMIYYSSMGTRLEPGEWRVWTEARDMTKRPYWNPNPPANGTYNVFGGMCEIWFSDVVAAADFKVPVGGAVLNIDIDSGVPAAVSTWGRIKALYEG